MARLPAPADSNARRPWRPVLAAVAACVVGIALLHPMANPGIEVDGVGYYAPLASMFFDRDLDFANELSYLNSRYIRAVFMTPEGRLGNPFPIGPSLLWAPAVILVRALPPNASLDAPTPKPQRNPHPAFAPRYARAVQFTEFILLLAGVAALTTALVMVVDAWSAVLACVGAVFGTPLFYYQVVMPSYGHVACFFAVALLTAAVWIDRRRSLRLELLGALLGLVALVRMQDIVFAPLLLPRLVDEWRAVRAGLPGSASKPQLARAAARRSLRILVPALVVFAPQMLYFNAIYGVPLLIPPGPDFGSPWKPAIPQFLFSTWNGVFVWSPLLLAGCLGLLGIRDRMLRLGALLALALEIYTCSVIGDWWGGGSFGARRFVSAVPVATVGLALLLQRLRASRPRFVAATALMTILCLVNIRLAQYKNADLLPLNVGDENNYLRFYDPGSPNSKLWGHWDYPRLWSEIRNSERQLQAQQSRQSG